MYKLLVTVLLGIYLPEVLMADHVFHGVVYDLEQKTPIPGVELKVSGTDVGTLTDPQGRFILEMKSISGFSLTVSHIGYAEKQVELGVDSDRVIKIFLESIILRGNEIQVTATRTTRSLLQVPGRVTILDVAELSDKKAGSIDVALRVVPGINIHRTSGDYEIRPVISMRGVGGDDPGRTLVLVDGVPINRADTGVPNLRRIRMPEVNRIEVLKGAGSSLYGASAMGGVINILTREAQPGFSGYLDFNGGTYNSVNIDAGIKQSFKNGLRLTLGAYSGNNDGYVDIPDSLQDEYCVPLFLEEHGANASADLMLSSALNLSVDYGYDFDKRGEGYRIEHELGNHRAFDSHSLNFKAGGKIDDWSYVVTAYFQHEDYLRISEALKKGNYDRFDVKSVRKDDGMNGHLSKSLNNHHLLSLGLDVHQGQVKGGDYYTSSTDTILNQGTLEFRAVYLQDEMDWLAGRLRTLASLRYDQVSFRDGLFEANNPSNAMYDFNQSLSNHNWIAWSPRVGLRYVQSAKASAYATLSRGFRAAPLDDITRSGFMRLGFKLANPQLGPETLTSFEFGLDLAPGPRLSITPSLYASLGEDFLYYVATGDSLWGSKPIYKRQNVTSVDIQGAELAIAYRPHRSFLVKAYTTINSSKIQTFEARPGLEGKDLVLTPRQQSGINLQWRPRTTSITMDIHHKGAQFLDDENVIELPEYTIIDVHVDRTFWQHLQLGASLDNLTDERYLENLERMSPGRLLRINASFSW